MEKGTRGRRGDGKVRIKEEREDMRIGRGDGRKGRRARRTGREG